MAKPDHSPPMSKPAQLASLDSIELAISIARPLHVGEPSRLEAKCFTPGYTVEVFYSRSGVNTKNYSADLDLRVHITSPPGEVVPLGPTKKEEG
jgi:hypothetical protein